MSVFEDIRRGLREREQWYRAQGGKVLIFGPGSPEGRRKRNNLARRLRRQGFEAHTSESLSKKVRSQLSAVRQEDEHWRNFDIVIVLDFSEGAGAELAAYWREEEFRGKAIVLYPEDWDPYYSKSFLSEVLKEYPLRWRASWSEWRDCKTGKQAVEKAQEFRATYFQGRFRV